MARTRERRETERERARESSEKKSKVCQHQLKRLKPQTEPRCIFHMDRLDFLSNLLRRRPPGPEQAVSDDDEEQQKQPEQQEPLINIGDRGALLVAGAARMKQAKQQQTAKARAAKQARAAENRGQKRKAAAIDDLALLSDLPQIVAPSTTMMGRRQSSAVLPAAAVWLLSRFAYSRRIRGAGKQRLRLLQRRGCTLIAETVLKEQTTAFRQLLQHAKEDQNRSHCFGLNIMWDETQQKMRSTVQEVLGRAIAQKSKELPAVRTTEMPVINNVMATHITMTRCEFVEGGDGVASSCTWFRQPWFCLPKYLVKQDAQHISSGLFQNMPVSLHKKETWTFSRTTSCS